MEKEMCLDVENQVVMSNDLILSLIHILTLPTNSLV